VLPSAENSRPSLTLGDLNGNYQRLTEDEAGSIFFKRFIVDLRSRMGQIHKPNLALSISSILELIKRLEDRSAAAVDIEEVRLFSAVLTYVLMSYVISLQGP